MTDLERYQIAHTGPRDEVLDRVAHLTHLKAVHPRMLSGPITGGFLTMVSAMIQPTHILEIGTFTAYSAICLSRGLAPGGRLDTIERNDELQEDIAFALQAAGNPPIRSFIGDAKEIIPTLTDTYSLVYIDADKREYCDYYHLIKPLVPKGGFILADNVLWGGKVVDPAQHDAQTNGIREFNALVRDDPEVRNVLLALDDGMMLIQKM